MSSHKMLPHLSKSRDENVEGQNRPERHRYGHFRVIFSFCACDEH
jgi:hypothetical protein